MTISKRMLTKWRKEALVEIKGYKTLPEGDSKFKLCFINAFSERILLLTQELLDQQLLKGK